MDHDLAIKNKAAERYLLGELNETEMEEYEEHFFSCTICAQEVKLGSDFIDHAREVFKTDFLPEPGKVPVLKSTIWGRFWNSLRQPAPAFAFASLLVLLGGFSVYQNSVITGQNSVIAELKQPDIATTGMFLRNARGPGDAPLQVGAKEPFNLRFDIPTEEKFSAYEVRIVDRSGKVVLSRDVKAEQANDHLQMTFRGGTLKSGEYNLIIRGINKEDKNRSEIAKYSFALTLQN